MANFYGQYIGFGSGGFVAPYVAPTQGKFFNWGRGHANFHNSGDGTLNTYCSPVQVGSATDYVVFPYVNKFTQLIDSANKLWTYGVNTSGELGHNNTTTPQCSPIQVGSLTDWNGQPGGGNGTALCIKSDGTLWSWGYGGYGMQMHGNLTGRSSPLQVGGLTTWVFVARSSSTNMVAKVSSNQMYTAGLNSNGQIGDGSTTKRCAPTAIGTTNWAVMDIGSYFLCASTTDGKLWCNGKNSVGCLGQGDTTDRSSPTQVGSLTDWPITGMNQISANALWFHCIKQDGTLWACGHGATGRLGDGTTTSKSSPVQIGIGTNWSEVSSGDGHTLAITNDGKMWAWASNTVGQLGINTTGARCSPTQIGLSTGWIRVCAGDSSGGALIGTPG